MRRDVRFLLIYIIRFCVQIELTDILEINSDSSDPVVFLRYANNKVLISTKTASLVYDFNFKTPSGEFDSELSSFKSTIRTSFVPQVYQTEPDYSFVYYYTGSCGQTLKVNSYEVSLPNYNEKSIIKQFNSTSYFFAVIYGKKYSYSGIANGGDSQVKTKSFDSSNEFKCIISFIPSDSSNFTILYIDNSTNYVITYTDVIDFENPISSTLTDLTEGIEYGDSFALEEGGFIFCYNTSQNNDEILCEKLGFVDGSLQRVVDPFSVLTCPSNRDDFFTMYKLGENKGILSCGYNPIHIQIIDQNRNILYDRIIIEESDYIRFELTVIDPFTIYLVGTLSSETDGTYFKGGTFQFSIDEDITEEIDNYNNYRSYYFESATQSYKECPMYCLACTMKDDQIHCLKCNNSLNYYQWRQEIYTCIERDTNPDRYQFDSTLNAFILCVQTWLRDSSDEVICYDICPEPYYLDPNQNNLCVDSCSNVDDYYLDESRECVTQCPDAYPLIVIQNCVNICPCSNPFVLNNICIELLETLKAI